MASLALMVTIIFLTVFLSGPIALLLSFFGLSILATAFGILSVLTGFYWCCFAPFPISLAGGLSAILGIIAINKSW